MASTWGLSWGSSWALAWDQARVAVPDVVGQSQASGTAELEGDGFVVAVETAYSSTVPAGDIISQVPTAGSEEPAGSTVTITVSLGEAPQPVFAGGHYWPTKRKKRKDTLEERIQEQRQEAERLRAEIAHAVSGEPEPVEQPTPPVTVPDARPAPKLQPVREVKDLRPIEAQLERVERALERYRAVEKGRQIARITELESFIETTAPRVLDAVEAALTGQAERLAKVLRTLH